MKITAKCPDCGRKIELEAMRVSPTVHTRTCRSCRKRWRIIVTPIAVKSWGAAHSAEFNPMPATPAQHGG